MSARPFCAVCLDYVTGPVQRSPIGRDGAMVVVCRDCNWEKSSGTEVRGRVETVSRGARGAYGRRKPKGDPQ